MRKPLLPPQKILPKITKFSIDSMSKYTKSSEKTLIEKLFYFPNFGQGFKVFLKRRPQDYYIVDNVHIKNNRHGQIYGMFCPNGEMENKISKIRNSLQEGRWGIDIPAGVTYTDNGVEYDIKKIEQLKQEKRELLVKRNFMIGYIPIPKVQRDDKKKAKLEAAAKKKK